MTQVTNKTRAVLAIAAWLVVLSCVLLIQTNPTTRVVGLTDADTFWRSKAFACEAAPPAFPSKEVPGKPQECDAGDMTLFNGLLCAAGESQGCDAVARSQEEQGRWWRSPRRIGWEAPKHDVSFSPDQSLGALLHLLQTGGAKRFSKWVSWLEANRLCLLEIGNKCYKYGWLRFCRDDHDKRCTLRPADCVRIDEVLRKLGADGQICRRVMKELGLPEDLATVSDEGHYAPPRGFIGPVDKVVQGCPGALLGT